VPSLERNQFKTLPDAMLADFLGEKPIRIVDRQEISQLLNDRGLSDPWQAGEQDMPGHRVLLFENRKVPVCLPLFDTPQYYEPGHAVFKFAIHE